MAKHSIRDVYVELGTEDISDRVASAKVTIGKSAVDITALGQRWEDYADGNIGRWGVSLELYMDYASSEVPIYQLIKQLAVGNSSGSSISTGKAFLARPSSDAASRFNPQIAGTVMLDGDLDFLNAARNEANKFTVALKGAGIPTFTDTSS